MSVLHIPIVHAHDVCIQIPREKNFSYLDERTLTYEPIVKYEIQREPLTQIKIYT